MALVLQGTGHYKNRPALSGRVGTVNLRCNQAGQRLLLTTESEHDSGPMVVERTILLLASTGNIRCNRLHKK